MAKQRLVVKYDNLPPGVSEAIAKQYPDGYSNHVIKVQGANNTFFYAIFVDTPDISYLVKVKVKKDKKPENDDDLIPDLDDGGREDSGAAETEEPSYNENAEE
jgi:hypothetical protein